MNIVLDRLEEKFLATALKNGLLYWKKDQFEIIDDSSTLIKAVVYGTDEYSSEIVFSGNVVTDVNCTCPNNRTLFCKHIAILYYEKFKDVFDLKKSKARKTSVLKKTKKTKISEFSLESKIDTLAAKQLKEIILLGIKTNNDFKSLLENKLNPKNQPKENLYSFCKEEISEQLRNYKKRGFIDYSASNKVGEFVIEYADKASQYFEDKCFDESFAICKAITSLMIKPLNYTDTSSGVFYQGLDITIDILLDIAKSENLQSKLRKEIYSHILKLMSDRKNHGWGYETNFITILVQLAANIKEKEELIKIIHNQGIDNYALPLYEIIKKFDGEKEADKFVVIHKSLPEFRIILFNNFMNDKNYEDAKKCMYEGLEVNKDLRGVVINWIKNLLKIGKIMSDKDLIVKSSQTLFLNLGFSFNPADVDYYSLLKSQFTEEAWRKELPLLIEKIKDRDSLEEVYYREGNSELLYKSISKEKDFFYGANHLSFNKKYIESLLPDFEMEIKKLLLNRIVQFIDIFKGKGYYKEVCQTLIRFKKLGIDVNEIILYLKENYPRRPSLMTRLNEHFY